MKARYVYSDKKLFSSLVTSLLVTLSSQALRLMSNGAASLIQALIRKKVTSRRYKRQLDDLLIEEGYSNLLVSRREGRRIHSANIIQDGYRKLRQRRLEKKSVAIIEKWFAKKQARFKRFLDKIGAGEQRILFQHKDKDKGETQRIAKRRNTNLRQLNLRFALRSAQVRHGDSG